MNATIELIVKDKNRVEKELCDAFLIYPKDEEVKELVHKYKQVYTKVINVEESVLHMVWLG